MAWDISAYQAINFKAFKNTGWIKISPITLVFGHNSAGKSALLSVLPMLFQTTVDPNRLTPFLFSLENGVDLGTYEEVIFQHLVILDNPIWFNIELSNRNKRGSNGYPANDVDRALLELGIKTNKIQIKIAASYNKKQRRIAITEFGIYDNEILIQRVFRKNTAINQQWHFEPEKIESCEHKLFWNHFFPVIIFTNEKKINQQKWSDVRIYTDLDIGLYQLVFRALEKLIHIGPLRDFPRRAYRMTGESPKDVGLRGENWLNILLGVKERASLILEVNSWLDRLGYTLRIEYGKQGYVHPMLKDKNNVEVSIKDAGFGISQLLPVLIQGFSCSRGTILILEQPEIHLHPKAQSELGDLLIAISKRGVRLLIETHSEHLLLRIQKRIAESYFDENKNIRPDDVSIYFIKSGENGSIVENIQLADTGQYISPPESMKSFFSGDYYESMEWGNFIAKIKEGKK